MTEENKQPIDFNQVMQGGELPAGPADAPESTLASKLDGFASAVEVKFNDVDSSIVVLDNRLATVEMFMGFIIQENPKILEAFKAHVAAEQTELKKNDEQAGTQAP